MCNTEKQLRFTDNINADMWKQAIDHVCIHAAIAASMHRRNITCTKITHAESCTPMQHHMLKGMDKEIPQHMLKDMYKV